MSKEKKTFVIAIGNAFDGLTLVGPFDDGEEANEDAQYFYKNDEWNVVKLEPREKACEDEEEEEGEEESLWNNDQIQFPRLLEELQGIGVINLLKEAEWQALEESMDLKREQILEIWDRAQIAWDRIKCVSINRLKANVRLIKAAPKLLAAIKAFVRDRATCPTANGKDLEAWDMMREVLAEVEDKE